MKERSRQQYDIVTLKVDLREARSALEKLGEFEKLFERFCEPLRRAVEQFHGDHRWEPGGTVLNPVVLQADAIRVQLNALQAQVMPSYKDPLGKLLRTSLRTDSRSLRELLGEVATVDPTFGEALYLISIYGCDRTIAESQGLIEERRHELNAQVRRLTVTIEETEKEQETQRAHEIAVAEVGAERVVKDKVKKSVRWLFEGSLRKGILWVLSLLVTGLAVYLFGPRASSWLRQLAPSADSSSVKPPPPQPRPR